MNDEIVEEIVSTVQSMVEKYDSSMQVWIMAEVVEQLNRIGKAELEREEADYE